VNANKTAAAAFRSESESRGDDLFDAVASPFASSGMKAVGSTVSTAASAVFRGLDSTTATAGLDSLAYSASLVSNQSSYFMPCGPGSDDENDN
jgi:hypothetical protein